VTVCSNSHCLDRDHTDTLFLSVHNNAYNVKRFQGESLSLEAGFVIPKNKVTQLLDTSILLPLAP